MCVGVHGNYLIHDFGGGVVTAAGENPLNLFRPVADSGGALPTFTFTWDLPGIFNYTSISYQVAPDSVCYFPGMDGFISPITSIAGSGGIPGFRVNRSGIYRLSFTPCQQKITTTGTVNGPSTYGQVVVFTPTGFAAPPLELIQFPVSTDIIVFPPAPATQFVTTGTFSRPIALVSGSVILCCVNFDNSVDITPFINSENDASSVAFEYMGPLPDVPPESPAPPGPSSFSISDTQVSRQARAAIQNKMVAASNLQAQQIAYRAAPPPSPFNQPSMSAALGQATLGDVERIVRQIISQSASASSSSAPASSSSRSSNSSRASSSSSSSSSSAPAKKRPRLE
jgi:hypothetical protein